MLLSFHAFLSILFYPIPWCARESTAHWLMQVELILSFKKKPGFLLALSDSLKAILKTIYAQHFHATEQ